MTSVDDSHIKNGIENPSTRADYYALKTAQIQRHQTHSKQIEGVFRRNNAKSTPKAKVCAPPPKHPLPYDLPHQQAPVRSMQLQSMPPQGIMSPFQIPQMPPPYQQFPQQQHQMYAQQQMIQQQYWAANNPQMAMPHYFPANSMIPMNFPVYQPYFNYHMQEPSKQPVTDEFEITVEDIDAPFNEGDVAIEEYLKPSDIFDFLNEDSILQ
ncbi:hypothetical protein M3Y98_00383400 [Aphelenchoides besseyi]|nr:hypothetical protein M3Y98_00383400 [Aphelenchoides besseyi]KAI6201950.1 hypothetical protein M3Y96_00896800 [Aphelenchoides besseyi]